MRQASSRAQGERDAAAGGGITASCVTWDQARGGTTTQPCVVLGARQHSPLFPVSQHVLTELSRSSGTAVCVLRALVTPQVTRPLPAQSSSVRGFCICCETTRGLRCVSPPAPSTLRKSVRERWGQPQGLPAPKSQSLWSEQPRVRAAPGPRVGVPGRRSPPARANTSRCPCPGGCAWRSRAGACPHGSGIQGTSQLGGASG